MSHFMNIGKEKTRNAKWFHTYYSTSYYIVVLLIVKIQNNKTTKYKYYYKYDSLASTKCPKFPNAK